MAKPRMAGDKLNEPTKESAQAKEAISDSERNKQIREEIGNDPERLAERISVVDRDAYDFEGFTDKQINMALQGEKFDDNDYARLTGKPIDGDEPKPEADAEPVVTPDPTPEVTPEVPGYTPPPKPDYPGMIFGGSGIGGQNISQNNDINTNITGDNNTVTNTQDNSIRQYGGASTASRAKMLRDRYVADVSRFVRAW